MNKPKEKQIRKFLTYYIKEYKPSEKQITQLIKLRIQKLADWNQHSETNGNSIVWQKEDTKYNTIAFWKIPVYCDAVNCTEKTHFTNSDIVQEKACPICEKHLEKLHELYHLINIDEANRDDTHD